MNISLRARMRTWVVGTIAALLLVACGGGDDDTIPGTGGPSGAPTTAGTFTAVVSFGDSLSDLGTYAVATSLTGDGRAPYFGGKFTTNLDGNDDALWVERVAAALGVQIQPHETGFVFGGVRASVVCPDPSCTSYAQGGARVTDPTGIGAPAGPVDNGFLTVPIKTQIANHLASFGSFKDTDLVFMWAGANDVLIQFEAFGAAAAQIEADRLAGRIDNTEALKRQFEALLSAQRAARKAALELAGYIKSQILGHGARYVVVMNLPDIGRTPRGVALGTAGPLLSSVVEAYNLWLREGLDGVPVQWFDLHAFFNAALDSPADYGLSNVTGVSCDPAKIQALTGGVITDGTSMFCNGTTGAPYNTLATGADAGTWLFADGIHPSAGGHREIGKAVIGALADYGWTPRP